MRFSITTMALSLFLSANAWTEEPKFTPTEILKQRKSAADRPRRILFNNDGGEPVMEMRTPTKQAFLDCRTSQLAGTQVDSIFYCSRTSGFGVFTHFTKVGQVFTCTEGRYSGNQMAALLKAGLDPLAMQVEFGHANKMEVFWSMRMNDTHDGSKAEYGPILFKDNVLKNAHPEWLIGTQARPPKHGAWSAVDYARPEIRDLAYRYLEEVCRNYDVDGVELDFFRHPVFFKSTSRGEVATREEREGMTSLVERIRKLVDAEAQRRGRAILIAVKLPDSVPYCHAIGLDLEAWLKAGLIDLLIPGGYFQLNEWESSIALGHRHGVKVYPSLDEPRLKDTEANSSRRSAAGYRGRAAQAWAAGGDGIYLFNFSEPEPKLLKELGDPKRLSTLEAFYFGSPRGVSNAAGGNYPVDKFRSIETLNPGNPKPLAQGKAVSARVSLGMPPAKPLDTTTLRVRLKQVSDGNIPAAKWDDRAIDLVPVDGEWFEVKLFAQDVTAGSHRVTLTPAKGTPQSAAWLDLMVVTGAKAK